MAFDNSGITGKEIEELEHKYLMQYWYFMKFAEDDMIKGLLSMNEIQDDWKGKYGQNGGISQFDVGSERIVYSLLNGKIAGKPNSSPVSSDLFFEVDDAFIHIDLKSVTTTDGDSNDSGSSSDNIGDFTTSIFVGENQNSYTGKIFVHEGKKNQEIRDYSPNLPTFYTRKNGDKKITLTYFVCLLLNGKTSETELVSIMCMPNGKLEPHYKNRPLKAGKNPDKTRFNFSEVPTFELLEGNKKRVRIIYKNNNMSDYLKRKLSVYLDNFDPEIDD